MGLVEVVVGVVLCGGGAVPDAFLSRREVLPLVEPALLSPAGRRAWEAGRVSAVEPRLGVPTFFWASPTVGLRQQGLTPEQAARRYLLAHAELYRADPARWADAVVSGVHDLHDDSAVIVAFQQRLEGVRVFRDELKVIMNRDLGLVALGGALTPATRRLGSFALVADSAVASAYQQLSGRGLEAGAVRSLGLGEGGYTSWMIPSARAPARTRPVYFPLPEGVVPAFYVELDLALEPRRPGSFSFVVSAVDGAVLYAKDLTATHTYSAWADPVTGVPWAGPQGPDFTPHPTGVSTSASPPPLPASLLTREHAGLSTNDPWLLPGATTTLGNNVQAYADRGWPSGYNASTDLLGVTTSADSFAATYDFGAPLAAPQLQAGVAQLFYVTNFLHDWYYDDGFDERAGNGQAQNFARGGAGNDALLAEAADGSWLNNADMSTPADGRSPRMQMYLFSGLFGDRDGTLDASIVAHEWGHFISNRLVGDGNGLSTLQSAGMGEGWGDFHAALLTTDELDALVSTNRNWEGSWALGSWAMATHQGAQAFDWGIRRYPLSADLAKNPLTFRHIADASPLPTSAPMSPWAGGPNAEVHNAGEVWAVMLWDCYVALLRDPRFTFEQARARMKRYLVAAYKATPPMPTLVEGRDALLAVAAAHDSADFVSFWAAFARRGLGIGASAPPRDAAHNEPLAEDFTVGNAVQILSVTLEDSLVSCDADGALDRDEQGLLRVQLRNIGTGALSGATVTVSASTTGVRFPAGTTVAVLPTPGFGTAVVEVPVALEEVSSALGGTFTVLVEGTTTPLTPVTATASFRLNFDFQAASSRRDDVEAPQSVWTPGADPLLDPSSLFRRQEATATQHFWFGPNPVATADSWLTSPPLQVGPSPLLISFAHRHDFARTASELRDGAVLEVSTDDGLTWLDVGAQAAPGYTGTLTTGQNLSTNPLRGRPAYAGQSARYPAFNTEVLALGTGYANQTIRFRFRVGGSGAPGTPAKGWELDDVQFTGITNAPFSSLVTDPNRCSNRAPVLSIGPDLEVPESARVSLVGAAVDPDGDAVTLSWTQTAGPLGVLNGTAFTAPEVSRDTQVTLQLTASDGRVTTPPREQHLLVKNVNRAPVATAPSAWDAITGETVTLVGAGVDSEGDPLRFEWTQRAGPAVMLQDATSATASFLAPAVNEVEVVTLELVVRDAESSSRPAVVNVTVRSPPPGEAPPAPPPQGCGCSSTEPVLLGLGCWLAWAARRRAVRPGGGRARGGS